MRQFTDHERIVVDTINTIHRANGIADIVPKKANTNGGEWYGPCIRCYKKTGFGGEDRFMVWPSRPIESPGNRMSPVFYCRRCLRDNGRPWSGDLPGYLSDILSVTWHEARKMLDLGAVGEKATHIILAPMLSVTGAPNLVWQDRFEQLLKECEDRLWNHLSAHAALRYLVIERGLNEETIHQAHYAYQDQEDRYEDPELWGLEPGSGKVKIPKGILIPEIHRSFGNGVEFYGGSIRRSNKDIYNESLRNGIPVKQVAKTPSIRGSVKSLLYGETLNPDKPGVLVEAWACAATVLQEAGDLVGCGATQSATGARDPLAMKALAPLDNLLLCYDPDAAGAGGSEYWLDQYEGRIMDYTPPVGFDLNKMHTSGQSVRNYIMRGIELQTKRNRTKNAYKALWTGLPALEVQTIDPPVTDPLVTVSEPIMIRHIDTVTGEVTMVSKDDEQHNTAEPEGELPVVCFRCGEEVYYFDVLGTPWCRDHVMCMQLMNLASSMDFPIAVVGTGEGLAGFVRDEEGNVVSPIMKGVVGCRVSGGRQGYMNCCLKGDEAQVWRMMIPLRVKQSEVPPPLIEVEEREAIEVEEPKVPVFGSRKQFMRKSPRTKEIVVKKIVKPDTCVYLRVKTERNDGMGLVTNVRCQGTPVKGMFCEEHRLNMVFLEYGEALNYPELRLNEQVKLNSGYQEWLQHAKHRIPHQLEEDMRVLQRAIAKLTALS